MNTREIATVLAALRYYQGPPASVAAITDIATDCGTVDPLTGAEIDLLCERLNGADGAPEVVIAGVLAELVADAKALDLLRLSFAAGLSQAQMLTAAFHHFDGATADEHHEASTNAKDELEIDEFPLTSRGDDGSWVHAWVWCSNAGIAEHRLQRLMLMMSEEIDESQHPNDDTVSDCRDALIAVSAEDEGDPWEDRKAGLMLPLRSDLTDDEWIGLAYVHVGLDRKKKAVEAQTPLTIP